MLTFIFFLNCKMKRVASNPERPPEINFNEIKSRVVDKSAIDNLEKAYKALSVKFPGDNNVSQQIIAEEKEHKERGAKLVGKIRAETKEANELLHKFEIMIPVDQMHPEEFVLTFPDWANSPQGPAVLPEVEKKPGLSKKEYAEVTKNLDNYKLL